MSEEKYMFDPTEEGKRAVLEKLNEMKEDKEGAEARKFIPDPKQLFIYDAIAHPKFDDLGGGIE